MKSVLLLGLITVWAAPVLAYTKGKTYKLTILHTNDHHGRFWSNRDGEVGLAPRATLIKQLREEAKANGADVLLLDAGDVNTGVPQSDMLNAEPDFKGMNAIGYDVMAVGNHEFDKTLKTIYQQRKWAGFPFISANIYDKWTKKRVFPSHITKKFGDLKVTIFGLTTEDTPLKSNPKNTADLKFTKSVEEAKTLVPTLRPNTDVLIALTHVGHYPNEQHGADAPGDVTLARQVKGIDLIVGGHTQKPLFEPDIQNGTIIVQAYEWGKYVGKVDLEILDGKVTLKSYKLIPVNLKDSAEKIKPDEKVEALLRPYKERGDKTLLVQIGNADAEYIGRRDVVRYQETNLGNLVARAYREKFKADIGLTNSGGIRDSIYPGKITVETVGMVLPFGGEVVSTEMTGKELKEFFEHVVFKLTPGSGSFAQTNNVDIVADKKTSKIKSFKIGGVDVVESKKYLMALPEFIAAGGDKYPAVKFRKYGYVDADLLKEFIAAQKEMKSSDFAPRGSIKFE
ncbi:5'-nucleotidase C-terminal domain-containing protein [Peredibacter sp. HCB2-198]|uniref:5'-nucleotidase C-terminal domain-containing protein n=1 Tax=Peredibacter sp. HCB2-198 TaxID=3383025 RepID=UPI0038B68364